MLGASLFVPCCVSQVWRIELYQRYAWRTPVIKRRCDSYFCLFCFGICIPRIYLDGGSEALFFDEKYLMTCRGRRGDLL
jgi:hypothetical protein